MKTDKLLYLIGIMRKELGFTIATSFITLKDEYMLRFGHGAYWELSKKYDESQLNKEQ